MTSKWVKKKILIILSKNSELIIKSHDGNIIYIDKKNLIFPTLFTLCPNIFIIEDSYLDENLVKILGRIKANKFYNQMRIYCYIPSGTNTNSNYKYLKIIGINAVLDENTVSKLIAKANSSNWWRRLIE